MEANKIAMPTGGIGTGTISIGSRGNLIDWAIMNRPAIGYTPRFLHGMKHTGPFFAVRAAGSQGVFTRLLEGPLDGESFESFSGLPGSKSWAATIFRSPV